MMVRVVRCLSCLAVAVLAGCDTTVTSPRVGTTYDLIAVDGRALPVTVPYTPEASYRFVRERLTLVSPTRVQSQQVAEIVGQTRVDPWELDVAYDVVARGDSTRLEHRCPVNARCAVPPRDGPAVFGDTIELREARGTIRTLRFVRRP